MHAIHAPRTVRSPRPAAVTRNPSPVTVTRARNRKPETAPEDRTRYRTRYGQGFRFPVTVSDYVHGSGFRFPVTGTGYGYGLRICSAGVRVSKIYIHADESCLGNSRERATPGGAAGMISYWTRDRWVRKDYWVSEPATTNNRMAIRSAIEGLDHLKRRCRVVFTSDSQYLVRAMSEWVHAWKRADWKRKTGPLENAELWQELYDAARRHDVIWEWVRGHAGHPQNEYANYLATRAAKNQDSSNGLVDSKFGEWLEQQREKYQKYVDFMEWSPPIEAE